MNGHIHETAVIVAFGNDILKGLSDREFNSELLPFTWSTCTFLDPPHAASAPGQWVRRLKDSGTLGLRLRVVAGDYRFGRYGSWFIEGVSGSRSALWRPQQEYRDMWYCTYRRADESAHLLDPLIAIGDARKGLEHALKQVREFAERHPSTSAWERHFRDAIDALTHRTSSSPFDTCQTMPPEGGRLLAAAKAGWAFGGMGNWDDNHYDGVDDGELAAVTKTLWRAMTTAVAVSVSSTFRSTGD